MSEIPVLKKIRACDVRMEGAGIVSMRILCNQLIKKALGLTNLDLVHFNLQSHPDNCPVWTKCLLYLLLVSLRRHMKDVCEYYVLQTVCLKVWLEYIGIITRQ